MTEYNFFADLLNKYSQLTPWVQATISLGLCGIIISIAYFTKESIAIIASILNKKLSAHQGKGANNEQ